MNSYNYRIVASTNTCYYSENQLFVQRSQYIRTENPLHKQSEKAETCHQPRRASTRDSIQYLFFQNSTNGQPPILLNIYATYDLSLIHI